MFKNIRTKAQSEAKELATFLFYQLLTIVVVIALGAGVIWVIIWKYGESSYIATIIHNIIHYEPVQVIGMFILAVFAIVIAELKTKLIRKQ